jgi:hypothetical protein
MNRLALSTAALGLAASAALVAPMSTALADTENCASRAEYDNLERGLTVNQVAARFDIYGAYDGDNDSGFRRAYRSCWAPGSREIVVKYSYNTGESVDWWVRDVA